MTEFRSPDEALRPFRRRVWFAGLLVLTCFSLLALRFHHLQVARFDFYHTRAEDNRVALLPVVPNRGEIYDRHGVKLAHNYSAYTLEINPSQVGDLDAMIERLSTVVRIDARDRRIFRKLLGESRRFETIPIRTRLSDEEVARFVAQRYRFPGADVRARLFRDYPLGDAGAHLIGYIGRINERDLTRIEERGDTANYRGSDYIGKAGLEQAYEADLHGTTGFEEVEVNASGRAVRLLRRQRALPGNNLELTLDLGLQRVAEQAFGARRGALVAIDPDTGGVLALVSMPTFDPNLFVDGISSEEWTALRDSPDHPMLNRAIYSAYPPGSTFKPFMAMAGLAHGKRTIHEAVPDPGFFVLNGHRFMDHKARGSVDLHESIVVSSNTYYYSLANELGIESIAEYMAQFGFGARTGIDIPGEATGVLPSPEWKRTTFSRPEQQRWYGGETISVGIGQGYNAYTPLQLANATATLVNGGRLWRPHLVRYVVDARTGEKRAIEPEPIHHINMTPEHVRAVIDGMVGVTREGTARLAFAGAPYSVGGKTGTAQVFSLKGQRYDADEIDERLRDHSLFIAFAPADKPRIALAVLVENGGFGSRAAAPIAREVLDYYLRDLLPEAVLTPGAASSASDPPPSPPTRPAATPRRSR